MDNIAADKRALMFCKWIRFDSEWKFHPWGPVMKDWRECKNFGWTMRKDSAIEANIGKVVKEMKVCSDF
jgi:hypothetical protein